MKRLTLIIVALCASIGLHAANWNPKTTDWTKNPNPRIGDWGFDRPGYPKGLYIHGVTVKKGKKVTNPVIYDNDVYDDVFDDEWMYAMTALKRMNLAALIVTPVLTDFWTFSHPDWIKTAEESRDYAMKSCRNTDRIPGITIGTEAESEKAGENKPSEGARLYVKLINEQYEKDPERPVIINIGGQAATLASAYVMDPSIAEKCIVYYTDARVYNGHYEWASRLVCGNFRVVSWGDDNWWIGKSCQSEWNVLPRPDNCNAKDNDENSGEWRKLTGMNVPMLSYMVHQFRNRNEYSGAEKKADGFCDGTFMHAWLPDIFTDTEIREVRGGKVIHVTKFTAENEKAVKDFAWGVLLDRKAYK